VPCRCSGATTVVEFSYCRAPRSRLEDTMLSQSCCCRWLYRGSAVQVLRSSETPTTEVTTTQHHAALDTILLDFAAGLLTPASTIRRESMMLYQLLQTLNSGDPRAPKKETCWQPPPVQQSKITPQFLLHTWNLSWYYFLCWHSKVKRPPRAFWSVVARASSSYMHCRPVRVLDEDETPCVKVLFATSNLNATPLPKQR
jgi:hypothetical protein